MAEKWAKQLRRNFSTVFGGKHSCQYPRFILRTKDFKIIDLSKRPEVLKEVQNQGFCAISYTWGLFQDQTTFETSQFMPTFDESIPKELRWQFPKIVVNSKGMGFTFAQLRGIIQNMNMPYVWWDMACIPQSWAVKGTDIKFQPQDPSFQEIKANEIGNQKFTYTLADMGVIWLHGTEFTNDQSKKGPVQLLLELDKNSTIDPGKYLALLKAVILLEPWFKSVWTYQEGVLLEADNVVDPITGVTIQVRGTDFYAELRDRNGAKLSGDKFYRGSASMLDITGRATLFMCDLAMALSEAQSKGLKDEVTKLSDYMVQLQETGLASYMAGSPLAVLQASKARGDLEFTREEDYCINAPMGGLQLTIPTKVLLSPDLKLRKRALFAALVERHGWRMTLLTKSTRGICAAEAIKTGMGDWISILGKDWDWTELGTFITTALGSSITDNYFMQIMKFVQPSLTGLVFGGTPRRRPALPKITHTYSLNPDSTVDALVVTPQPQMFKDQDVPYQFYVYGPLTGTSQAKPWTAGRFYASEQTDTGTRKLSRCVMKSVTYEQAAELFGGNFALIPLEDISFLDSDDPNSPVYTRCVILGSLEKGTGSDIGIAGGGFYGIGDFVFPPDGGAVPVQTYLGSPTWSIYMY